MNSIWMICLGIACLQDYCRRRIPNWLIGAMLLFCCIEKIKESGIWALPAVMATIFFTIVILFPLFRLAMLGAGDLKLIAVCIGYLGAANALMFLFYTFLAAAVSGFIHFCVKRDMRLRMEYMVSYFATVFRTGKWSLYFDSKKAQRSASVCMAGPVLFGYVAVVGGFLH